MKGTSEKQIIEKGIIYFVEYLDNITRGVHYAGTDRRISLAIGNLITVTKQKEKERILTRLKEYLESKEITQGVADGFEHWLKEKDG